jgi:hypothetical protein
LARGRLDRWAIGVILLSGMKWRDEEDITSEVEDIMSVELIHILGIRIVKESLSNLLHCPTPGNPHINTKHCRKNPGFSSFGVKVMFTKRSEYT